MAGGMRKMAVYLGLAEDEYREPYGEGYDDGYDEVPEDPQDAPPQVESRSGNVSSIARPKPQPQPTDFSTIKSLKPKTYNEARTIGESFRDQVPVIMNLGDMDPDDAKRLVDFAAGLTFGLRGTIERISSKVFLLSPEQVSVTSAEKQRLAAGDFYNQS